MDNQIILKYHNDLNNIVFKGLTARESNVFFAICAMMKDHGLESLTLSFDRLKKISNITTSDEKELINIIKETYQKLLRVAAYYETDVTFGGFILFDKFEGNLITRTVTISVNPKFSYMINELTQNFTVMQLQEFTNIQSTYTKILYRQLQQYKSTGIYIVDLEFFKILLDVPSSYDMRKITQKILTPSINTLSSIFPKLEVEKIREGRFIKKLKFTFNPISFESEKFAGVDVNYISDVTSLQKKSSPKASKKNKTQKIKDTIQEKSNGSEKLLCPYCDQPLTLIKNDSVEFYGHANWKHSNCKKTFSSVEDIIASKKNIEQEIIDNKKIEDDIHRLAMKNNIVKLIQKNAPTTSDGGDHNDKERIVIFNFEDVARRIPYTEEGLKNLETYLEKIKTNT